MCQLETRLREDQAANERAAKASADLDERLRLGVRMLQAFDVQVERGERASQAAQQSVARADESLRAASGNAETALHGLVDRLAREKLDWIERELSWRFDRVKEVEERIEQAANAKLAWLDGELASRLARIDASFTQAQEAAARAEATLGRLGGIEHGDGRTGSVAETVARAEQASDRAERATAALAGLVSEGQRHLETLVARTGDATHLREALGTLVHELAAAREFVQGDLRRMRDDLGWLVEKGERLGGDLVERADRAVAVSDSLRASTDAADPVLSELAAWTPLLAGTDRERLRPVAEAIAGCVRDELSADMRGFSSALRQLATRADSAFSHIRVDPDALAGGHGRAPGEHGRPASEHGRELVRSFAHEVARLAPVAHPRGDDANLPIPEIEVPHGVGIGANRPMSLETTDAAT